MRSDDDAYIFPNENGYACRDEGNQLLINVRIFAINYRNELYSSQFT